MSVNAISTYNYNEPHHASSIPVVNYSEYAMNNMEVPTTVLSTTPRQIGGLLISDPTISLGVQIISTVLGGYVGYKMYKKHPVIGAIIGGILASHTSRILL